MYKFNEPSNYRFNEDDILEGTQMFLESNSTPKGEQYDWDSSAWTSDGKYVAYVTKSKGSDWKTIRIKDLETMKDFENDVLTKVKFSMPLWDTDNKGFFYARYDDAVDDGSKTDKVGPNRVYYHKIDTKQSDDILIYENPGEPDASFSVYKTQDDKYLVLTTKRSTEETCLKHFVDMSSI